MQAHSGSLRTRDCRYRAEANRPRVAEFLQVLDSQLKDNRFIAGPHYTVADITAQCAVDFMKVPKLAVPESCGNVKRWHAEVAARPSANA